LVDARQRPEVRIGEIWQRRAQASQIRRSIEGILRLNEICGTGKSHIKIDLTIALNRSHRHPLHFDDHCPKAGDGFAG
jgi:hypothetical protein